PKKLHAGVNSITSVYTTTAALSAGDVIQMVKLPDRARVLEIILAHRTVDGSAVLNVGDGGAATRFGSITASTVTTTTRLNPGLVPYQYSLSDDAAIKYDTVDITVGTVASQTPSTILSLTVLFQVEDDG
ncbi:MAG: hypothetical protein ACREGL_09580, partial [Alphaproteobacteria bacterium]